MTVYAYTQLVGRIQALRELAEAELDNCHENDGEMLSYWAGVIEACERLERGIG